MFLRSEGHACQYTYWSAIFLSLSVKRKASIYLNGLCQCWSENMLHEIMISIKLVMIIIITVHQVPSILSAITLQAVCYLIFTTILHMISVLLVKSQS